MSSYEQFCGAIMYSDGHVHAATDRYHPVRLHRFLVSVSVSGQYQHFLMVSESVRYVTQVPIPLLYEVANYNIVIKHS